MVIIFHDNNKVVSIENFVSDFIGNNIVDLLFEISKDLNVFIYWCHISQKENLNRANLKSLFSHNKQIISFSPTNYLRTEIGYVNSSTSFLNVNKTVSYPTYIASSLVGGIHSSVVKILANKKDWENNFDYFLCSISKLLMEVGIFCYSNPNLLLNPKIDYPNKSSISETFKFVKQHQKVQWVFILFFCCLVYERKIHIVALIKSFFYKQISLPENLFDNIIIDICQNRPTENFNYDVIIPTIGRKIPLYDFLKDLSNQTVLPKKVIIIEQNPILDSVSELDYIKNEDWPFQIDHSFTNVQGVCRARNKALSKVNSDWVFFADDDIKIQSDFIEEFMKQNNHLNMDVYCLRCYQKGEKIVFKYIKQWDSFGSGCSLVRKNVLEEINFLEEYEYGYGEDADFGMQLRNKGIDIVYLPYPEILHSKAPIGGFRTTPKLPWHDEPIMPRPRPTLLMFWLLHRTKEQLLGYKFLFLIQNYKNQPIKNPIAYIIKAPQSWNVSFTWAKNYFNALNQKKG